MLNEMTAPTAADIIRLLGLQPHPEGGHFRETFRDPHVDANGRAASTAIYFLLARGERSRWHKVDAVEIWHWHAGAPLALHLADDAHRETLRLGDDLAAGERPQGVVPTGVWQAAESLGDWTLVGCTVARDSSLLDLSWRRRVGSRNVRHGRACPGHPRLAC